MTSDARGVRLLIREVEHTRAAVDSAAVLYLELVSKVIGYLSVHNGFVVIGEA